MLLRWTIALLICIFVIWSITREPTSVTPNIVVHEDKTVDYFIEHVELTSLDATGNIDYQLKSQMLYHHRDGEKVYFETPDIFIFENRILKWQVNAEKGEGDLSGSTLKLSNDVLLTDFTTEPQTQLSTSEALIDRDNQTVESDEDVLVTMGLNQLEANGLQVDLASGVVNLNSDISATFSTEHANVQN